MRTVLALCVAGLVIAATAWPAEACSCETPRLPCDATWRSAAVFTGKVISIAPAPPLRVGNDYDVSGHLVVLEVSETFRGASAKMIQVRARVGSDDCSYPFEIGKSYLVYAHQYPTGDLNTGRCTRTRPIGAADGDLAYLRSFNRRPSFVGRVFAEVKFFEDTLVDGRRPTRPYEGATVTLRGADGVDRTGTSTRNGTAEIAVPVGFHEVTVRVPPGRYAIAYPQRVEMRDVRGCGEVNVSVRFDGRVAGRVVDLERRPVPYVTVALDELGQSVPFLFTNELRTRTDVNGDYEFIRVPAGEFALGVGVDREFNDDRRPFVTKPAFYPGVTEIEHAQRVSLTPAGVVRLDDFVLPANVRYVALTGTALLQDGSAASAARVYLKANTKEGHLLGQPAIAGADGRFTVAVPATGTFLLSSEHITGRPAGRYSRSDDLPVTADTAGREVTLRLRVIR